MFKQVLYIILIVSVLFSCQKEKLQDNEKKLIGKWKLLKTNHTYSVTSGCYSGIKTDEKIPTILEFKKNGTINLSDSTGNYEYYFSSSSAVSDIVNEYKFLGCINNYTDSIIDYHKMDPIIYYSATGHEYQPYFYYNNSILMINSNTSRILDDNNSGSSGITHHIFEKVN